MEVEELQEAKLCSVTPQHCESLRLAVALLRSLWRDKYSDPVSQAVELPAGYLCL